jgi:hypothetical protein
MTAEEFISTNSTHFSKQDVINTMIEFAKLHAEAALKAVSEKQTGYWYNGQFVNQSIVDKESILNAYPLTNIK